DSSGDNGDDGGRSAARSPPSPAPRSAPRQEDAHRGGGAANRARQLPGLMDNLLGRQVLVAPPAVAWGTGALASLARAACALASLAGHRPFAITGVALAGATSIVILLAGSLGAVPQFPFEHYQRDPR